MFKAIENIISKNIAEFNKRISEKYGVDISELDELWSELSGGSKVSKAPKKTDNKDSNSVVSTTSSKKSKIDGGCPYVFIKGKDEGNTCSSKPKDGCTYCSKHQKCEGTGQKDKKKVPAVDKKTISSSKTSKPKESSSEKPKIFIRLNKEINKYWFPETNLVFKSKDERVVCGSYIDSKINALTQEDIAVCEKYGFKYEKSVEENPSEKSKEKKSISADIEKTNTEAKNIETVLSSIFEKNVKPMEELSDIEHEEDVEAEMEAEMEAEEDVEEDEVVDDEELEEDE